jgi:hypothetical protein
MSASWPRRPQKARAKGGGTYAAANFNLMAPYGFDETNDTFPKSTAD